MELGVSFFFVAHIAGFLHRFFLPLSVDIQSYLLSGYLEPQNISKTPNLMRYLDVWGSFFKTPQKFENEPSLTKTSSKICCNPTYIAFVFCRNGSPIFYKQLCTGKSLLSPFLAGPFLPFGTALRKGLDLGSSVVVKTAEISTWASSWKPMPARATMSSKLPESSRRCGRRAPQLGGPKKTAVSGEEKRYEMALGVLASTFYPDSLFELWDFFW